VFGICPSAWLVADCHAAEGVDERRRKLADLVNVSVSVRLAACRLDGFAPSEAAAAHDAAQ
jgi:hypothetical protein